ncbi:MAG: PAS domain-containing sensor histidine kinase [Bacteroides sp.]|nr:PAS domain-containing sensor histidine kinase [Bacteroides sp.]
MRLLNIALSRMQIFQWSHEMDRDLMVIDPRYFEYLGIPTKDYTMTTKEFMGYLHPDDVDNVIGALASQLGGNLNESLIPYRLRRQDGTWEWFEVQSTYVGQLADAPFRVIGICMSTQKYKDTEARLNEALQEAQRSDQLKSMFLANMSHKIRTPLNAIVGFSTLLASEEAELSREEISEFSNLIEKNSETLTVLISDILDLSKIESNTMEFSIQHVSLNKILADIGKIHKMNMPDGVEMILDMPEQELWIDTDPMRLGQVVNNLINNAVKFTHEGHICLGYHQSGSETIELFLRDTGTGISEEVLSHVFERFFKENAFVQGTGLGLPICKNIVEHLNGTIGVTSKEGEGTCFTVTLPLVAS